MVYWVQDWEMMIICFIVFSMTFLVYAHFNIIYFFVICIYLEFWFCNMFSDVGVMSGAIIFIQEDWRYQEIQEVLVWILSIVSLLGSLAGGRTSDAIGRKWTIALAAIVFQSGAAIMSLAPSCQILMIGRLLAGIRIGFGVMIAPVYIAKISPSIARGTLTSFPEILWI